MRALRAVWFRDGYRRDRGTRVFTVNRPVSEAVRRGVPPERRAYYLRRMDAVSALLRAAIRIAGASAAIVAYDDDHHPVAFTGCSQGAAAIALRDGSGAYIDCRTPITPMTLVLLEPARPTAGDPALIA